MSRRIAVLFSVLMAPFTLLGASAPLDLGSAGPKNWALLGLGGPTNVSISGGAAVKGSVSNVGVPATGNLELTGGSTISGKVYLNAAGQAQESGGSVIVGGIVKNADATLKQAVQDALAASGRFAAMSPTIANITTINITSPKQNLMITGGAGLNVVRLTGLIITNGTLTLNAPPGGAFLLNVSGSFQLSGPSQIRLVGGVAPLAVAYNVTGPGQAVSLSGQATVTGIVLAPQRNVQLTVVMTGEVIAGGPSITLSGQASLTNPYQPPTITSSATPAPNAAGWNNTNVIVTFTCAAPTSGVTSCTAPVTVSTDGANQVITGTVVDNTGNMASASVTVNLDKTPPTVTIISPSNGATVATASLSVQRCRDRSSIRNDQRHVPGHRRHADGFELYVCGVLETGSESDYGSGHGQSRKPGYGKHNCDACDLLDHRLQPEVGTLWDGDHDQRNQFAAECGHGGSSNACQTGRRNYFGAGLQRDGHELGFCGPNRGGYWPSERYSQRK